MMKLINIVLIVLSITLFRSYGAESIENPHEVFNVQKVNSNNIAVTFISTQNIQKTCDQESRKRGYGGFPIEVEACSFWDSNPVNNKCTIVVGYLTNFHTIGHEMRHCLQGNFHK